MAINILLEQVLKRHLKKKKNACPKMFRVSSFILFFFPSTLLYLYQMCVPSATIDLSSQANIEQVKTAHLHLNWNVDFDTQILHGNVVLDMITLVDNVNKVILDTSYLEIKSVTLGEKESLKVKETTQLPQTFIKQYLCLVQIGRKIC